jgi:hypothetical protein
LRDFYPQLSDAERKEREDFVVTACWHMRDRFDRSETMKLSRSRIFSRIVPTVKDIGLWGPQVQEAFVAMGAIEFAKVDAGALLESDARKPTSSMRECVCVTRRRIVDYSAPLLPISPAKEPVEAANGLIRAKNQCF